MRKPAIRRSIPCEKSVYGLTRLGDREHYNLRLSSIAIEEISPYFEAALIRSVGMSLGEFYSSMKFLFGERSRMFDDWKCAFSFPLSLEVPGASRKPAYLLDVTDFRGSVEHSFRKLVDPSDPRLKNPIYYPPDPGEFPVDQMQSFLAYLAGFQKGYFEAAARRLQKPFLLSIDSNNIHYGFDGKEFFEEHIDSSDRFEERRIELGSRLPSPGFFGQDAVARRSSGQPEDSC